MFVRSFEVHTCVILRAFKQIQAYYIHAHTCDMRKYVYIHTYVPVYVYVHIVFLC